MSELSLNSADFIVIGGGSAGCAVAAGLANKQEGSVLLLEAGPSHKSPFVSIPFGLVKLMGSKRRDWRYKTSPQSNLQGRQLGVPRGKMLGGSGSINSMVWFRGCHKDFDDWEVEGWAWSDVEPAFQEIEARFQPTKLASAHGLVKSLGQIFKANDPQAVVSPEYESAGVFEYNLHKGRRRSPADVFLNNKPENLHVLTGVEVDHLVVDKSIARQVKLIDGKLLTARKGIILSAGSIGSPAILMRSGVGASKDLLNLGIDVQFDAPEVGENLHDHPSVGLYFKGKDSTTASGYGVTWQQAFAWALAPLKYALQKNGRWASPTVEGGSFFNARGLSEEPDIQSHFIPFKMSTSGSKFSLGSGYFADVCLCRPKSRGQLKLVSKDPKMAPRIDLGLFSDQSDMDTLVAGLKRLRSLLKLADFGDTRGTEMLPGENVNSDEDLEAYIKSRVGTAYHPVGTLRMGQGSAPVSPRLKVKGVERLWVADASVMPKITSANTNAPSIMIGHRAAGFITKDAA
ncbi:MAG: GMC family oxidoreductase [Alphaproteobacteria bacterium]